MAWAPKHRNVNLHQYAGQINQNCVACVGAISHKKGKVANIDKRRCWIILTDQRSWSNLFETFFRDNLIIRPFWVFNPCALVILNEFRNCFWNYFRCNFFFLILKRYNFIVPKDFPAKSNFHTQISFPQISASTFKSNSYNISKPATNITTRKYFLFSNTTLNIGQQFTNKDYLINIPLYTFIKNKLPPFKIDFIN